MRWFLFIVCGLITVSSFGQYFGSPVLKNYTPLQYNAHVQNWDALQDNRGIMYFANTSCILEFDGQHWKGIPNANRSTIRSLAMDSTGIIYAGGIGELGMLVTDASGQLAYQSLVDSLPQEHRRFNDVWRIFTTKYGVYFITLEKIFILHNQHFEVIPADVKSLPGFLINQQLYVFQNNKGLFCIKDTTFISMPHTTWLTQSQGRIILLPFPEGKLLIFKDYQGFFIYHADKIAAQPAATYSYNDLITPFTTQADEYLKHYGVYSQLVLPDGKLAIGTVGGGIVIIDTKGILHQIINKNRGLNNDIVLSLFSDNQQNLWATLIEGISCIDYNSPITIFSGSAGLEGTAEVTARSGKTRYVGMLSGAYYLEPYTLQEDDKHDFKPLLNRSYNCWAMLPTRFGLFATGPDGLMHISGTKATQLNQDDIIYCFGTTLKFSDWVFTGNMQGVIAYKIDTNYYKRTSRIKIQESLRFSDISEPIRWMASDKDANLWLTTNYNGILKIEFTGKHPSQYKIKRYTTRHGLPRNDWNYVYYFDNQLYIASKKGIYIPDPSLWAKDSVFFIHDTGFPEHFVRDSVEVTQIQKTDNRTFWVESQECFGKVSNYGTNHITWDTAEFVNLPDGFKYFDTDGHFIWFATPEGLYCYDTLKSRRTHPGFNTLIREIIAGRDSVLFSGTWPELSDTINGHFIRFSKYQPLSFMAKVPYHQNTLRFQYNGIFYMNPEKLQYAFRLLGLSEKWSVWSNENKTLFTNLRPGDYVFEVKSRNHFGVETETAIFRFVILPPWYMTWWAYVFYFMGFIFIVWMLVTLITYNLRMHAQNLENLVKKRTEEVVAQKKEIEIKNAELELQKEEITAQRDEIESQRNEITLQRDNLEILNAELQQKNEEILAQRDEIIQQRDILVKQKIEITDSLQYAWRLQNALLPALNVLTEYLKNYFILYLPKDIVSGDFYWIKRNNHLITVAVADCTGHGVPGAFMSMLSLLSLDEITLHTEVSKPGQILDQLRYKIKTILKQSGADDTSKDGLDIALFTIDFEKKILFFSGAFISLYIVRSEQEKIQITELEADRQPVAIHPVEMPFKTTVFNLCENDIIYAFTDGYPDQIGGNGNCKFRRTNFKKFLTEISQNPMPEQKKMLLNRFEQWKSGNEQVDDVLVLGMKI